MDDHQIYSQIVVISTMSDRCFGIACITLLILDCPSIYFDLSHGLFNTFLFLVYISVGLAIGIPKLALFISLIGAFSSSALAIIFPPLMDELTFAVEGYITTKAKIRLCINLFIVLFGVVGFAAGTYVSVDEIILSFKTSPTVEPAALSYF